MSLLSDPRKSDLPTYLTREVKDEIMVAASLGWKVHIPSDGNSVTLHSYDDRKRITFGTRRQTPIARTRRDIVKHADPALLKKADDTTMSDAEWSQTFPTVTQALVVHDVKTPAEPAPLVCKTWHEGVPHRQHKWFADADTDKMVPYLCEGMEESSNLVAEEFSTEPHIVSERVMVAKGSETTGYESPTTKERFWSDGSRDYACRHRGCEYHSTNRGSVGAHWARSKDHDHSQRVLDTFKAEVPEATKYAPRKTRVEALAAYLSERFQVGDVWTPDDAESIAREVLTWVHDQSARGTDLAAEQEPMTADETLARIRTLLDTGERRTLLSENERLIQEHIELEQRVLAAEAETTRIREEWKTLADLISSIREERQGA